MSAKQIDFLLSGLVDASGAPLSGAIVVTKDSAGANAKAVWEDKAMTLPTVLGKSQFTLDSEGKALVFGNGVYTILIYAATDIGLTSPIETFSGVSYTYDLAADLATHEAATTGVHGVGASDIVGTDLVQTLTNKTLSSPTIADFTNATHDHQDAGGGGLIAKAALNTDVRATAADQETGTAVDVFVAPAVQHRHVSAAKAWVVWNGTGTISNLASYNVTSLTDHGTGDYTITWATDFSTANYCPVGMINDEQGSATVKIKSSGAIGAAPADMSAGSLRVHVTTGGSNWDSSRVCIAAYGDQ